jgi:hypothetical protein
MADTALTFDAETALLLEQLIERVTELEAMLTSSPAALFGEVLLLPGVKHLLARCFYPDKPGLNKAERRAFTEARQKILAAYDRLEKEGRQSWLTVH